MPERAIVLSCSAEDESGRPLARSPFLDEVTRLLGMEGEHVPPAVAARPPAGKIVSTSATF